MDKLRLVVSFKLNNEHMVTDCFCYASNSPQTDIPLVNIHVDNKLEQF